MFAVKIYKGKQLMDVRHYTVFQNALADIGNKSLFGGFSNETLNTLGNPEIRCMSYSPETGTADDFELRYQNGITVCIGEVITVDGK